MRREQFAFYFRNFIFGVEDSLVSTVGLLSGIAISDVPRATILLSGLVLIFVEAFSMGVGSFLAEDSGRGVLLKKDPSAHLTVTGGLVMFISYFCAGFLPLAPYIFLETHQAFPVSIALALLALFVLGILAGILSSRKIWRSALRMMLIGGVAILLGVFVGSIVHKWSAQLLV